MSDYECVCSLCLSMHNLVRFGVFWFVMIILLQNITLMLSVSA